MLKYLRDIVSRELAADPAAAPGAHDHGLKLATALLMIEMSRADAEETDAERRHLIELIEAHFALPRTEAEALLAGAAERADAAVSLHEFTRLLNGALAPEDKRRVVELLWRVAFADGRIDRYEDYLVRKIADLLYVPHAEFIRAKLKVQGELAP